MADSIDDSGSETPAERVAALFDRHQPRLYRLALRMCQDPEEARDLVQEAFLRAARRSRRVPRGERGEEAWLVRVLVNLGRDRWRRLAVRERLTPRPALSGANPEGALVARATVTAALARLSPKRRAVVVLRELEGLPSPEVGRLLGMSGVTVRWHLHAARKELRSFLDAAEGRPDPEVDDV